MGCITGGFLGIGVVSLGCLVAATVVACGSSFVGSSADSDDSGSAPPASDSGGVVLGSDAGFDATAGMTTVDSGAGVEPGDSGLGLSDAAVDSGADASVVACPGVAPFFSDTLTAPYDHTKWIYYQTPGTDSTISYSSSGVQFVFDSDANNMGALESLLSITDKTRPTQPEGDVSFLVQFNGTSPHDFAVFLPETDNGPRVTFSAAGPDPTSLAADRFTAMVSTVVVATWKYPYSVQYSMPHTVEAHFASSGRLVVGFDGVMVDTTAILSAAGQPTFNGVGPWNLRIGPNVNVAGVAPDDLFTNIQMTQCP